MLRALIWIVMIVAIAVGLTLLARYSTGYVLVVSAPYRIELSLNLLLLLLAAAFIIFYLIVRMFAATARLPGQVREYRAARRRRKARATLATALHEYFAGRYARAEKAAQRATGCSATTMCATTPSRATSQCCRTCTRPN